MRRAFAALALASCAHLREPAILIPVAVLAPVVALDATVTIDCCRRWGCVEMNPVNAPFVYSRWLYAVNAVELALWVGVGDHLRHRATGVLRHAWIVSTAANFAISFYAWRSGVRQERAQRVRER